MGKGKGRRKGPKTLFDKVKEIDPYFVQEVYVDTDEKLNERLLGIAQDQDTNELAQESDTTIKSLREQLRVANETYNRPLKACKLKRKLIVQIQKERRGEA
jgi:hypothetical protein